MQFPRYIGAKVITSEDKGENCYFHKNNLGDFVN